MLKIVQESRAAASKPRDAEGILFGLMFTNQTNLTKQNRLCLKADLNANANAYEVSLFQPKFRGIPFGAPLCCGLYIPKTLIIFDVFDHDT